MSNILPSSSESKILDHLLIIHFFLNAGLIYFVIFSGLYVRFISRYFKSILIEWRSVVNGAWSNVIGAHFFTLYLRDILLFICDVIQNKIFIIILIITRVPFLNFWDSTFVLLIISFIWHQVAFSSTRNPFSRLALLFSREIVSLIFRCRFSSIL